MCVVVDANRASSVFGTGDPEFAPVLDWLQSRGTLIYGGKLAAELLRVGKAASYLRALRQAGRARLWPEAEVEERQRKITDLRVCKSNDPHVLALVCLSGARTVCTEDKNLWADLRNRAVVSKPKVGIYRTERHRALLKHTPGCYAWKARRPAR
jgi:hypothetical protein